MNIYEPEGSDAIVDLRRAAAELRSSGSITGESTRKATVAEIQTAALLDIALSLRVVAAEARAAMPSPFAEMPAEPESDEPRDFLIVGDLVTAEGMDEPGEIRAFGQSEGAFYAEVSFAGGAESRVWIDALTRLYGDERDEPSDETVESIVATVADEIERTPAETADLVDDIDGDFDGDTHTAAATAHDTHTANEAARKAAKKKGSKK